jgi:hypothetical protein
MSKLFQPGGNKTINCGWIMLHGVYHSFLPSTKIHYLLNSNLPYNCNSPSFVRCVSHHTLHDLHAFLHGLPTLSRCCREHRRPSRVGHPERHATKARPAFRILAVGGSSSTTCARLND